MKFNVVFYDEEEVRHIIHQGSKDECLDYCKNILDFFTLDECSGMVITNAQTGEVVKCIVPF